MALELLVKNTDFYTYRSCTTLADMDQYRTLFPGVNYGTFCQPGHPYVESIYLPDSFVYDASTDRYRFITANNIGYFPSWEYTLSVIHPETGVEERRTALTGYGVAHAWTEGLYNGGLNKTYAGYVASYRVVEITRDDGIPNINQVNNPVVTATQIPILSSSNFGLIVCPERKLITILNMSQGISVYDYSPYPSAGIFKWRQPFPEAFGWSVGYEDDQRMWGLFSGSIGASTSNDVRQTLVKYNYLYNRYELLTELQPDVLPDRMATIAFDTKRKKLAAVRIKADDADGKYNNAFEIYSPRPAMVQVSVPVNIKALTPGTRIPMRLHLLGTKGEGGTLKPVTIAKTHVDGHISNTQVYTSENGAAQFDYSTNTDGITDTVTAEFDETKVIV